MALVDQLRQYREEFIARLGGRRSALVSAMESAATGEAAGVTSLEANLHQLTGSAGVHGLAPLSEAALAMLVRVESEESHRDVQQWAESAAVLARLDEAMTT